MKKFAVCLMSLMLLFAFSVPEAVVDAKTLTQLQQERNELKKKTEDAKKALEEAKQKTQSVEQEIGVLDQTVAAAENELGKVEEDLAFVSEKLAESEKQLAQAMEDKEKQLDIFGQRIKFIYERGQLGYLDVLLQAGSFSDLLTRMQYVNDIMDYDNEILESLKEKERVIAQKTEDIKVEKSETEKLVAEQKEKTDSLNALLDQKKQLLLSYEQDEKKYAELIASNEKASSDVERLIQQATAAASSSSGGSGYVYTGGKLNWPVPARAASSSSLSSGYVGRRRPIGSGYEFHTGYDIPAPYGSNIVAAEAGTVITAGWVNGYGNTVIINHGGGLSTLYGHNSRLVVSVGQSVKRGDVIAKCGSTGNSTGNHCHFEVRVNGKHTSPEPYLGVRNIAS